MTTKEAVRLTVLTQLATGTLSQAQAANQPHRSVRQVKRRLRVFRQDGEAAVRSKRQGNFSNRKSSLEIEATILKKRFEKF